MLISAHLLHKLCADYPFNQHNESTEILLDRSALFMGTNGSAVPSMSALACWQQKMLRKIAPPSKEGAPFKMRSLHFEWEATNPRPLAHRKVRDERGTASSCRTDDWATCPQSSSRALSEPARQSSACVVYTQYRTDGYAA